MQTKLQSIEFHNMKNTRRVKNYDNIDIVTGTTSWENVSHNLFGQRIESSEKAAMKAAI